jgi:hypothetical protein
MPNEEFEIPFEQPAYAFESGRDFIEHLTNPSRSPSLGDYFKRFIQTPQQAMSAEAARAPRMMVVDEGVAPPPSIEPTSPSRGEQIQMLHSLMEPVQDLGDTATYMPPDFSIAVPPDIAPASRTYSMRRGLLPDVEDEPQVIEQRVPPPVYETPERPITSIGPALGPFPQDIPHSRYVAEPMKETVIRAETPRDRGISIEPMKETIIRAATPKDIASPYIDIYDRPRSSKWSALDYLSRLLQAIDNLQSPHGEERAIMERARRGGR